MALTLMGAVEKLVVMAELGMGGPGAPAAAGCRSPYPPRQPFACWLAPPEVVLPVERTGELSGGEDRRGHRAAGGELRCPPMALRQGRVSSLPELLVGLFLAARRTMAHRPRTLPDKSCGAYRPAEGFSPGMSQEVLSWFPVSTRAIKMFEVVVSPAGRYPRASRGSAPASRCIGQLRPEFVYWKKKQGEKAIIFPLTLFIPQLHQCFLNILKTNEGFP